MRSELCIHDLGDRRDLGPPDPRAGSSRRRTGTRTASSSSTAEGRLFRVPLDAPALEEMPTGRSRGSTTTTASRRTAGRLAISAQDARPARSCIYLMPLEGGEPVRVTAAGAVLVARLVARRGAARLCRRRGRRAGRCRSTPARWTGRTRCCVTEDFDHVDGPDYTPDGAWIWFNGEREGRVDLWRVRPDGSDLAADDRRRHGGLVPASLAGRAAGPLPRLSAGHQGPSRRPRRGAPPDARRGGRGRGRSLRLHGGQGTINVPCWAPDGRRFAFMRFAPYDRRGRPSRGGGRSWGSSAGPSTRRTRGTSGSPRRRWRGSGLDWVWWLVSPGNPLKARGPGAARPPHRGGAGADASTRA